MPEEAEVIDSEETEFESAFEEMADAKDKVTDSVDEVDPDDPDLLNKDDPDNKDDKDDKGDKDDKDDEAAAAAAAAAADKEDPYDGMSEAAKARHVDLEEKNEKLNHRISSDSGRVRGFQKKSEGLELELTAIKAKSTAAQPTADEIKDAMKGSGEEWDQFAEDYPQVATAIDNRLAAAGEATSKAIDSKLKETLDPINEREAKAEKSESDAAATAAHDVVAEVFPTWAEAIQEPEFNEWLVAQPPGVAALSDSDDTNDALVLIGMYDNYLVANDKPSLKPIPNEPGDDTDKVIVDGSESDELANRRTRQLAAGSSVPSKSARVDGSAEAGDEFEDAFEFHAKRNDAKRTA